MGGIFSKKKQVEEVDPNYDNGLTSEQEQQLEMDLKQIDDIQM
jgi:hypothetical protein